MNSETILYNNKLESGDKLICDQLMEIIDSQMPEAENKIRYANPVWFLDGNPIVGYDKMKNCVRLLFWSGQGFEESSLQAEGKFKAAEKRYTDISQINSEDVKRWVDKAKNIQWDYKNIVKRKGVLERLK